MEVRRGETDHTEDRGADGDPRYERVPGVYREEVSSLCVEINSVFEKGARVFIRAPFFALGRMRGGQVVGAV